MTAEDEIEFYMLEERSAYSESNYEKYGLVL